jgi:hypothetical protein
MACKDIPGNLVAETLALDDGDLRGDTLVGVEVGAEASVELLDDLAGGLLHCLVTNATPAWMD